MRQSLATSELRIPSVMAKHVLNSDMSFGILASLLIGTSILWPIADFLQLAHGDGSAFLGKVLATTA